ncbi:hypothetical protein DA802_01070 [Shouchella clausii]|nr:hypothetical protein DA802_01070 [Shouchella clausii]
MARSRDIPAPFLCFSTIWEDDILERAERGFCGNRMLYTIETEARKDSRLLGGRKQRYIKMIMGNG